MAGYSKKRVREAVADATEAAMICGVETKPAARNQALLGGGKDVFVSMPTGSGKSLCYCLLPKVFDALRGSTSVEMQAVVIVVSPLDEVCSRRYQLVYLSPEALLTNATWRDMLQCPVYQQNLVALVVDEAHCVKKW